MIRLCNVAALALALVAAAATGPGVAHGSEPAELYQKILDRKAQDDQARQTAAELARLRALIDAQAAELDKLRSPDPDLGPESTALTYAQARLKSLRTGKPLIVWIGESICPECIGHNAEEFVHFVAQSHPQFPADSLTVSVPVNGQSLMAGQVRHWPDGHLPTVRMILRKWDALPAGQRKTIGDADLWWDAGAVRPATPAAAVMRAQAPAVWSAGPPMMQRPVMGFPVSAAACAT